MNEWQLTYSEFYLYVIIGGAIVGALLGLLPLLLGRRRNKARLGMYGFVASIVSGAIAPLLSILVGGVFSWLFVRDNKPESNSASDRGGSSDPK